eukprot:CAMPEP_0201537484 /NCGR_PEP_ID=MMETSP0161_2-20130828/64891_1 /ASSEMBLY_ACC=CAM_ASM_000251 /TAXON_ID=180227 /ORGANISM="Neoparamoeba aestuarina, Strain SoJaBio B1-5/56/2" /LENGTH=91 /DNA_ID=CAMNT_0047943785 /DNA_START=45 /DNA_END=317 /DNA_ORIENTATION=-
MTPKARKPRKEELPKLTPAPDLVPETQFTYEATIPELSTEDLLGLLVKRVKYEKDLVQDARKIKKEVESLRAENAKLKKTIEDIYRHVKHA